MQNYDFNDFLKAVKYLSLKDKIETAKLKLLDLGKAKNGSSRKEASAMSEKIRLFLHSLSPGRY